MVTCKILSINLRISGGWLVGEDWRPKQDVPSQLFSLYDIYWPTRWREIDQRDEWKYIQHYFILSLQHVIKYRNQLWNWYTRKLFNKRVIDIFDQRVYQFHAIQVNYTFIEYYLTENYRPDIVVKQRFWLVKIIPRILGTKTNKHSLYYARKYRTCIWWQAKGDQIWSKPKWWKWYRYRFEHQRVYESNDMNNETYFGFASF